MKKEERLTWKRDLDGHTDVGLRDGVTVGEAICKLADYEDLAVCDGETISEEKVKEYYFAIARQIKEECDNHNFYKGDGSCEGCVYAVSGEICPFDTGSVPADWEV